MKTIKIAAVAGVLGMAGVAMLGMTPRPEAAPLAAHAASEFAIDSVHSGVVFKIQHAGVSNFYGRFNKLTGSVTWDSASPESTTINATIDAASVDSNNKDRDKHLSGTDFFNAKQFPEITFKSTTITKKGENTFELAGEVSMVGKSKPVTGTLVVTGEKDAGKQFGYRVGMEATFTIKRTDFGMSYGVDKNVLGDDVTITVGFAGVRKN